MKTLSAGEIDAIIAGVEGVTPGPWERKGASVQSVATGYIMETSGTGGYVGSLSSPRGSDQRDIDAAYIARVDPATVLSLATEVKALRAESLRTLTKLQAFHFRIENAVIPSDYKAGLLMTIASIYNDAVDGALNPETHSGTDE